MNVSRNPSLARARGFTLVEVSLAITIAAVALLAIVSMMPLGYDANRKALESTRVAQFAEDILAAARGEADSCVDRSDFNGRIQPGLKVSVVSRGEWDASTPGEIVFSGQNIPMTFVSKRFLSAPSHELTYQASIQSIDTYSKRAIIRVWPGVGPDAVARPYFELNSILTAKVVSNAP